MFSIYANRIAQILSHNRTCTSIRMGAKLMKRQPAKPSQATGVRLGIQHNCRASARRRASESVFPFLAHAIVFRIICHSRLHSLDALLIQGRKVCGNVTDAAACCIICMAKCLEAAAIVGVSLTMSWAIDQNCCSR